MEHQERDLDQIPTLESMNDGLTAFNELLELMGKLANYQ